VRSWLHRRLPPRLHGEGCPSSKISLGGKYYDPELEHLRDPALHFEVPAEPYSAYVSDNAVPSRSAKTGSKPPGWKGWTLVSPTYVPPTSKLVSVVAILPSRIRPRSHAPCPTPSLRKKPRSSPVTRSVPSSTSSSATLEIQHQNTAPASRPPRSKGWTEVPPDFIPSTEKMVNSVVILPTRLRRRKSIHIVKYS
jgi:hypothetical protein